MITIRNKPSLHLFRSSIPSQTLEAFPADFARLTSAPITPACSSNVILAGNAPAPAARRIEFEFF